MRSIHFPAALLVLTVITSPALGRTSETIAQAAIRKGNDLVAKGRFEEAVTKYESVREESGDTYAVALYNIGVCYYELWQIDRAISFYRRALEARKGRYPRASYALGIALEDAGKLSEAGVAYEQTLYASGGKYPLANFRLGLLASRTDLLTASAFFRKALEHSGEHVPATHNNLGVMLARMHRLTEAEKEFVAALRLTHGDYHDAVYNLKLCRQLIAGGSRVVAVSLRVSGPEKLFQKEN
jgi:tetratricopeptide (TPR) repeat protein